MSEIDGTCQVVQWLGLWAFTARGTGSTPGEGTRILHAVRHSTKEKKTANNFKTGKKKLRKHIIFNVNKFLKN